MSFVDAKRSNRSYSVLTLNDFRLFQAVFCVQEASAGSPRLVNWAQVSFLTVPFIYITALLHAKITNFRKAAS